MPARIGNRDYLSARRKRLAGKCQTCGEPNGLPGRGECTLCKRAAKASSINCRRSAQVAAPAEVIERYAAMAAMELDLFADSPRAEQE